MGGLHDHADPTWLQDFLDGQCHLLGQSLLDL